jgi:ubiquinone/menaquinone biosynthesis C-methylase UbiE
VPVVLTCPSCRVPLTEVGERHSCPACRRGYGRTLGIPDLRVATDETAAELELVSKLSAAYERASFEDLAQLRNAHGCDDDERRTRFTGYSLSVMERGQRLCGMFRMRLSREGWLPGANGTVLDVGCGVGAGVVALAKESAQVFGVDVSLSALIVAKKLMESEGLTNVTLVRASGRQLPFPDDSFTSVVAINVLEHVGNAKAVLAEVRRVLAEGGAFSGDSRNRYDLFFREPHVGLRWIGFLPRRWARRYVRWRLGVQYEHRLLSYSELQNALQAAFGAEWRIAMPLISAYGRSVRTEAVLERVGGFPMVGAILIRLSPSHVAIGRRPVKLAGGKGETE